MADVLRSLGTADAGVGASGMRLSAAAAAADATRAAAMACDDDGEEEGENDDVNALHSGSLEDALGATAGGEGGGEPAFQTPRATRAGASGAVLTDERSGAQLVAPGSATSTIGGESVAGHSPAEAAAAAEGDVEIADGGGGGAGASARRAQPLATAAAVEAGAATATPARSRILSLHNLMPGLAVDTSPPSVHRAARPAPAAAAVRGDAAYEAIAAPQQRRGEPAAEAMSPPAGGGAMPSDFAARHAAILSAAPARGSEGAAAAAAAAAALPPHPPGVRPPPLAAPLHFDISPAGSPSFASAMRAHGVAAGGGAWAAVTTAQPSPGGAPG
jgi:hypothetical protein